MPSETVTLREYFEALREDDLRALQAALTAERLRIQGERDSERLRIDAALISINERLKTMNEFRGAMSDMRADFMPRGESIAIFERYSEKFDSMAKEVQGLRESRSEGGGEKSGKLSQQSLIVLVVGLILSAIAIAKFLIKG